MKTENVLGTPSKACPASSPGEKAPECFFFFFFLLPTSRRQGINQNHTLQHPGHLAHGKPTPSCTEKNNAISPQQMATKLLACMKLHKKQVNITHHAWLPYQSPHPTPCWENNPAQSLSRLKHPPAKLITINSKL
jgi:hypothetical protein